MLMCGANGSFCHVKAKKRWRREELCVWAQFQLVHHNKEFLLTQTDLKCSWKAQQPCPGTPDDRGLSVHKKLSTTSCCGWRQTWTLWHIPSDGRTLRWNCCKTYSGSLALQSFFRLDTAWASSAFTTWPKKKQHFCKRCSRDAATGVSLGWPCHYYSSDM